MRNVDAQNEFGDSRRVEHHQQRRDAEAVFQESAGFLVMSCDSKVNKLQRAKLTTVEQRVGSAQKVAALVLRP